MLIFSNLVQETTVTTGTGSVTLAGASTGFRTFNSAIGSTGTAYRFTYVIRSESSAEWEFGIGYLSDATTLVRDLVTASSNSNALVSLSSGTHLVALVAMASSLSVLGCPWGNGSDGDVTISGTSNTISSDKQYRVITWSAAATAVVTGGMIFCQTLDMSAATVAGSIYSVGVAGAAGASTLSGLGGSGTVGGAAGGDGGATMYPGSTTGGATNGAAGEPAGAGGGRGGIGGGAAYGRGGRGGLPRPWPVANPLLSLLSGGGQGGGGGGGACGHNSSTLLYAGGGGEGAPSISIFCRKFIRPTAGVAQMIRSTGGAGGTNSASHANVGCGSGGGGGRTALCYAEVSGTSTAGLLASIGGAGGTQTTAGVGGYGGMCMVLNLSTGVITTAGPTANSTTTGGVTTLAG